MTDPITLALAAAGSLGVLIGLLIGVAASRCYHTHRLIAALREVQTVLEQGE